MNVKDYPELSWKKIKQVLENKGFSTLEKNDRHYVNLKKDSQEIRIIKVEKVPRLFLQHIIDKSKIDIKEFI